MDNPLISIIVPVYNVAPYLDRCLKSLESQTYRNIEVIMVDDGSSDSSGKICDTWTQKDQRFKVIHQHNNGVSAARNTGIRYCDGQYVVFVDSDDFTSEDMCQLLYTFAKESDADIVMAQYAYVDTDQTEVEPNVQQKYVIYNQENALIKITSLNYKAGINVFTKLYKSNIVKNHLFKEGYALGEDQEYVFESLRYCSIICVTDAIVYYYVKRNESATNSRPSIEHQKKLTEIYNEIVGKDYYPKTLKSRILCFRICQCEMTIINSMVYYGDVDKKLLEERTGFIKEHTKEIIMAKFPVWKKIQMLIAGYLFSIYRNLIKHKKLLKLR